MPQELVKTGISGLDPLLSGGFIKGSTVLVSGNYGVGKTLFALQYAFHQARRGERVLYVSTSEPVFKVRKFAGSLEFFDDALLQTSYRDFSPRKGPGHAGSVEFVESSLGIITGLHLSDESSLVEEIRNMVEGKGIQHLIIDPITTITMLYESEMTMRKDLLLLGAWLARLGCTVLLTAEASDLKLLEVEKYLADCVIDLESRQRDYEREFLVSVQKLRGNRQNMSGHLYTLGRDGIAIIRDLSAQKPQDTLRRAVTGVPGLDRVARLDYGTCWVIAADDRACFEPLLESVLSEGIAADDGIVYAPPVRLSFSDAEEELRGFGVDLAWECERKDAILVDHYARPVPDMLKPAVVAGYPEIEDVAVVSGGDGHEQNWRIVADLNGERYAHGADALRRQFAAGQARARDRGDLCLWYGNLGALEPELAAFVRATCDGLIEVRVRGNYQFLKVAKSPDGFVSCEHVLVPLDCKPYTRVVPK